MPSRSVRRAADGHDVVAMPVLTAWIAGPREESLVEMARLLMARRGDPVRIEGMGDPADPDRDVTVNGGLLPGPDATLAGPTFEDWLATTI